MVPAQVMMMSVNPVVWIVVIVLLIIVFGAAKLPDIARNVGKSAKVLREELAEPEATKPTPPVTPGSEGANKSTPEQLPPDDTSK